MIVYYDIYYKAIRNTILMKDVNFTSVIAFLLFKINQRFNFILFDK